MGKPEVLFRTWSYSRLRDLQGYRFVDLCYCRSYYRFFYDWKKFDYHQFQIELVWKSRWSFMKIIYLMTRYLAIFDTCANLICLSFLSYIGHSSDSTIDSIAPHPDIEVSRHLSQRHNINPKEVIDIILCQFCTKLYEIKNCDSFFSFFFFLTIVVNFPTSLDRVHCRRHGPFRTCWILFVNKLLPYLSPMFQLY